MRFKGCTKPVQEVYAASDDTDQVLRYNLIILIKSICIHYYNLKLDMSTKGSKVVQT